MRNKAIKVLLVDDHHLVRAAIKLMLRGQSLVQLVGEANNGLDALQFLRQHSVDVVLLDLFMEGIDGFETTRRILQFFPNMKILIVSSYTQAVYAQRLLKMGVKGYISKGASSEELLQAIQRVVEGESYLSADIASQLALKQLGSSELKQADSFDDLQDREWVIMRMLLEGQSIETIADKLYLSPKTVHHYRYQVFEKLNVNSNVELVLLAHRCGLLVEEGL